MIKIGFSGTRLGMTIKERADLESFLILARRPFLNTSEFELCEFHHGDCVGADAEAHEIATRLGYVVVVHPSTHPLRAHCAAKTILPIRKPLDRNHDIVDSTDMLVAAPSSKTEVLRSGTWATIRYARKHDKPVIIL